LMLLRIGCQGPNELFDSPMEDEKGVNPKKGSTHSMVRFWD